MTTTTERQAVSRSSQSNPAVRLWTVTALTALARFFRSQADWRDGIAEMHDDEGSRKAAEAQGALATYLDSADAEGLRSPITEAVRTLGEWYRSQFDEYVFPERVQRYLGRYGFHGPADPARYLGGAHSAQFDHDDDA